MQAHESFVRTGIRRGIWGAKRESDLNTRDSNCALADASGERELNAEQRGALRDSAKDVGLLYKWRPQFLF